MEIMKNVDERVARKTEQMNLLDLKKLRYCHN